MRPDHRPRGHGLAAGTMSSDDALITLLRSLDIRSSSEALRAFLEHALQNRLEPAQASMDSHDLAMHVRDPLTHRTNLRAKARRSLMKGGQLAPTAVFFRRELADQRLEDALHLLIGSDGIA